MVTLTDLRVEEHGQRQSEIVGLLVCESHQSSLSKSSGATDYRFRPAAGTSPAAAKGAATPNQIIGLTTPERWRSLIINA